MKALTYEEFIELAKENYHKGGDVAVECWESEQFDYYVKMFGSVTKTKAMRMFKQWKDKEREQAAMMFEERNKMNTVTVETVMKYIPKKSQIKIAELILEDLGGRKTRYHVILNENYWMDGNREFHIENFKELLKVLNDRVIYDETPEPWAEEFETVEKTVSKTAYMKKMREFYKENLAGNTEEITFKEWFSDHMAGLEYEGKIIREVKNGKEVTKVII